jgi:hypothetical protein|tara:strand:+ start:2454 stop:2780 length:327 start_codon:yes stop_codon:yes gene_type:complete
MQYSQLKIVKISKRRWQLLEDWKTPFGVVQKGFISNGANVPRILWSIIPPAGELFEAAIVHDYHYYMALGTKKSSDLAFKQVALDFGVSKFTATAAYYAVYLFGWGNH